MKDGGQNRVRGSTFILWFLCLLCLLLTIISIATLILAIGLARDPTKSLHGMISSALWTTVGPHLMLISLIGAIAAFLSRKILNQGYFRVTLMVNVLALISSSFVTLNIVQSIKHAGGDASILKGLWLEPMVSSGPDLTLNFESFDGVELPVAVYKPRQTEAPILMYIHGGGFMTGTITESDAELRWFAEKGWLVISVGYRLWTKDQPTWNLAPADIECAAEWVQNNVEKHGGDFSRLAILGDSAGGNLAINFAYSVAGGIKDRACQGELPQPKGVVVQYPAVDPLAVYEHGYPIKGFEPEMLVEGYIGGSPYEYQERVETVSSYSYINEKAPPTMIIEPDKDGLVPAWSVYQFVKKARSEGLPIELVSIPFANHVYNQIAKNSIGSQGRLTMTFDFLKRNGLAPERDETR